MPFFYSKDTLDEVTAQKYRMRVLERDGDVEVRELTFVKY